MTDYALVLSIEQRAVLDGLARDLGAENWRHDRALRRVAESLAVADLTRRLMRLDPSLSAASAERKAAGMLGFSPGAVAKRRQRRDRMSRNAGVPG